MPSLFRSTCLAALLTAGLACAATIDNSSQSPDPSDMSSSMDSSGDPGMIVSGDSQPGSSNQNLPQGPLPNLLGSVNTEAVPAVPEPSTVFLIGGAACAALIGRRKLARR